MTWPHACYPTQTQSPKTRFKSKTQPLQKTLHKVSARHVHITVQSLTNISLTLNHIAAHTRNQYRKASRLVVYVTTDNFLCRGLPNKAASRPPLLKRAAVTLSLRAVCKQRGNLRCSCGAPSYIVFAAVCHKHAAALCM